MKSEWWRRLLRLLRLLLLLLHLCRRRLHLLLLPLFLRTLEGKGSLTLLLMQLLLWLCC